MQQETKKQYESYDAIVFEPVILKLTKNPKVHAVLSPGVILYVRLIEGEPMPETVPAVAFQDIFTYHGVVPTSHIGIGLKANSATLFEAGQ